MSDDLRKRVMSVEAAEAEKTEDDSRQVGDPLAEAMIALAAAIQRLNTYLDRQDGMGELPSRVGNAPPHSPEMPTTAVTPTSAEEVRDTPPSAWTVKPQDVATVAETPSQQSDAMAFPPLSVRVPTGLPELPGDAIPYDTTQPPRFVAMTGIAWPEPQVVESRPNLPVSGTATGKATPEAMPAIEPAQSIVAPPQFAMPPLPTIAAYLAHATITPPQPSVANPSLPPLTQPQPARAGELPAIEPTNPTNGQPSPLEAWFNSLPSPPSAASWPSFPLSQASTPPTGAATITPPATSSPATDPSDAMLSWFSSPPVTGREPRLPGDAVPSRHEWSLPTPLPPMPNLEPTPSNVRDMPPWMRNNTAGTDAHRDILDAMQGFSDATRDFNAKVVAVLAAMTADMRQSHSRLENVDRYFHSER